MMFGHDFYHGTLRKYVIMFGNLFDEITVDRRDVNGNLVQTIHLPIVYGPKQKWLARVEADPDLNRPLSITLPRLAFTLNSMNYAPNRKLNTAHKLTKGVDIGGQNFNSVYAPVPYDMQFSLYAMVKNAEDGVQIVEQIVPFFTPDFTVTMHALPEMGIKLDVPIELNSISSDDSYEGDFESRRVLTWQMDFTVKGYLFGPINKNAYINKATVTLNDDTVSQQDAKQVWKGIYEGNNEFGFTETIIETSQ
jgi:hypothetical protein